MYSLSPQSKSSEIPDECSKRSSSLLRAMFAQVVLYITKDVQI